MRFLLLFLLIFSMTFVSAVTINEKDMITGVDVTPIQRVIQFNNNTGTVNSSDFWDDLDTPTDITDGIFNSTAWLRDGTNVILRTITDFVGINTTTPSHPLNVVGDINATGYINASTDLCIQGGICLINMAVNTTKNMQELLNFTDIYSTFNATYVAINTTGNILNLIEGLANSSSWNRTGTDVFLSNTGDNVGIGTSTPEVELNIISNTQDNVMVINGSVFLASSFVISEDSNGKIDLSLISSTGSKTAFFTSGTDTGDNMYVNNGKRFGIGTASPTHDLNVLGTTNLSGNTFIEGTLGIGTPTPTHTLNVVGDVNITKGAILNDEGGDNDFRVESLNNPNMIFMDALNGRLHINTEASTITGVGNFNLYADSPKILMVDNTNLVHWSFGSGGGIFQITETTNTGIATGLGQVLKINPTFQVNAGKNNLDFHWHGDTTSNLFYMDAGTEEIQIGRDNDNVPLMFGADQDSSIYFDGNNRLVINADEIGSSFLSVDSDLEVIGDVNYTGNITGGNFYYGEMWVHNDTNFKPLEIITQGVWTNVSFNITDASSGQTLNGFTFTDESNALTSLVAGKFKVSYSISVGNDGNNEEYEFAVAINDVLQNNTDSHRKIGAAGDVGNAGGTGFIDIVIGDMINLQTVNVDNSDDLEVHAANLNLVWIGN